MRAPSDVSRTTPARLRVLVTGISGAGLVVVAACAAQLANPAYHAPTDRTLLVLALVVAANALPLHVRFGSNKVLQTWGEVALVLGLALVPLPWLVVLSWLGDVLAHAPARRGWAKTTYNAGTAALGTLLAGGVVELLGTRAPVSAAGLSALVPLVAGSLTLSLFCDLVISVAIATAQRVPLLVVIRDGFLLHQLVCLTNGAVAVVFVVAAGTHVGALATLPVVLTMLHLVQASGVRVAQERDAWQRLDVVTRELNQLNRRAVVETAIVRAAELFRSDAVEIVLDNGEPRLISGTMRGVEEHASAALRLRTVVTRPLEASDVRLGELRLCFVAGVRLSEREKWALSTFSHALSAALLNAQLYEEMQEHAALKAHEAAHDPLTGLANRTALTQRGSQIIEDAARHQRVAALLLIDLDHFKQVNDTLGHDAGDQLLREVAHRLLASVRASDLVVRLGGDEFAVLLPDLPGEHEAGAIATTVRDALAEPMAIDGLELPIEASIGVACAPIDASSVRDLLRCADVAMYQAKGTPLAIGRYRPQSAIGSVDRLTMVSELHPALEQRQLVMHFQPKVNLRTGRVVGAEALARWCRPRHGMLPAADFVPVIEQSSLVHGFALYVLDTALAAAGSWGTGPDAPTVAVNLSARNFLDRNLPRDVAAALARHRVAPSRLIVEITETVMMTELDIVDEVLAALRRLGVQLSVDDFGTGFSSLTFLSRVSVDEVKIDRSFVAGMLRNAGDAAIVRAVVELGRSFGLRVVAEGVEVRAQQEQLAALGCEAAQGYYLARPMPAAELGLLLDRVDEVPALAG